MYSDQGRHDGARCHFEIPAEGVHDRVLLRLMNSKLFSLACLAQVGDCDAFLDGLGAERARVGGGGARRAHEEVSARPEEDGARALHAHDALVSVLRLVALALNLDERARGRVTSRSSAGKGRPSTPSRIRRK